MQKIKKSQLKTGEVVKVSDLLKPIEDWEVNEHCRRSITYHHQKRK